MQNDPVCGMEVDEKEAKASKLTSKHEGKQYHFCSPECKKSFEKAPGDFTKKERPSKQPKKTKK